MAEAKHVTDPGKMIVSVRTKTIYSVLIFIGAMVFLMTAIKDPKRAWHGYLTAYFYFMSLGLGGLFFTAIQHLTKAGWSVNIRRIAESFTAFLPIGFLMGIVMLVFGANHMYEWLHPDVVAADPILAGKVSYLNRGFFSVRMVVFFGLWLWFAKTLVGYSLKQDETGDESFTIKSLPWSVACILVFALSYSLFSVDLLMALDPHWFSTIFGIYCFAGLFQSTIATIILIAVYFIRKGQLTAFVNENHLHDLGKFLFAFTVFWAYIAFSQFMLIWYANLPEETTFYIPRVAGGWLYVSIGLLIFKFIVPFLALLPRWAKRTPAHLVAVSILILVMQFVDLYWLVYPNLNEEHPVFSIPEVAIFLGFLGMFIFAVTRFLSKNSIVPVKDPRIEESLHHHVVY